MTTVFLFGLIGALAGLSGMILGIINILHNRMAAVTACLEYTREPDFIEARNIIWELSSYDAKAIDQDRVQANKLETVINTYNMIGLLVRHHQLPKWFFEETSAGDTVIKFYDKLKPFIDYQRQKNELETYANQFEYLYKLLCDKSQRIA